MNALFPHDFNPLRFSVPLQIFYDPKWTSEQCLMAAVLEDAYKEALLLHSLSRYRRQLAREALAWFAEDDEWWPFSFVNICAALNLDPEWIRQGVLEKERAA